MFSVLTFGVALATIFSHTSVSYIAKNYFQENIVNMNIDGSDNILNPLSFSAFVADNETYYYHEMIRQPDAVDFLRAMVKEVHDHTQRKHWVLVPRSKAGKNKIIRAVWSFKRKRLPDGLLLKHKARLCVNGSMQVYGINYWNTYAPVVSWLAVRLMFILSIVED